MGLLLSIAAVICLILAAVRLRQGYGWLDALVSAVSLAVAALPEEFPVVFTVFLGVGVYRLARRQALVRRAVVVENIGRITSICSDKTGTITEGKLTLAHLFPAEGIGVDELRRIAVLASRAASGDPIDVAILGGATGPVTPVVATFPFTEDRRRETGILRVGDTGFLAAVKGAPETIFAITTLGPEATAAWLARTEELGATAHK